MTERAAGRRLSPFLRRVLPAAALLAAGCSSQWYPGVQHSDVARTDVVIHTVPEGATIEFGGRRQSAPSPIRVPVNYDHTVTMYERQSNHGASMREGMSPVVQVLTFPVWAIASFFHYREEMKRHEYGGNVHEIVARLAGYAEARQTVRLEGEAEVPVTLTLERAGR